MVLLQSMQDMNNHKQLKYLLLQIAFSPQQYS